MKRIERNSILNFKKGGNMKYCNEQEQQDNKKTSKISEAQHSQKKKRKLWVTILLWLFFMPIMAIITIIKSKKLKKPIKAILVVLIVLVIFFMLPTNPGEEINKENKAIENQNRSSETAVSNTALFSDIITDDALRNDFFNACEQVGIEASKIKDFKQVDDWVGGTRYSFTYSGASLRLYCNMDSTVNSIKLGVDTDIYKQGYEPYQISDYLVDSSVASELQSISEEYVKEKLKYPSSADFAWLDWAFGRERDLYSVSSSVQAKNAFGVEREVPFKLIYQVKEKSYTLMYFEMDGKEFVNDLKSIKTTERKKIKTAENKSENKEKINLVDGELGDYGKEITLDGQKYINYYVPSGKYKVINNGKWCTVFVAKDEYYKNSDGYMENKVMDTVEFSENGETKTISVKKGEHIELTVNASISLELVQ